MMTTYFNQEPYFRRQDGMRESSKNHNNHNIDEYDDNNDDEGSTFYNRQVVEATAYHDRGIDLCYGYNSQRHQAIGSLQHAARIRESLLGKYHPDTALTYFRIASILGHVEDDTGEIPPTDDDTVESETTYKDLCKALMTARRELRITYDLLGGQIKKKMKFSLLKNYSLDEISFTSDTNLESLDSSATVRKDQPQWLQERMEWIEDRAIRLFRYKKLHHDQIRTEASQYCLDLLRVVQLERKGDEQLKEKKNLELALTCYNNALALESTAFAKTYNYLDMADLHVKVAECLVEMEKTSCGSLDRYHKQEEVRQPRAVSRHSRPENYYDSALVELEDAEKKYRKVFSKIDESTSMPSELPHTRKHREPSGTAFSNSVTFHTSIGNVLAKKASIYLLQNRFDEALATYAKVYNFIEATFGPAHPKSKYALSDIRLVTVREMEHLRKQELGRKHKSQSPRRKR